MKKLIIIFFISLCPFILLAAIPDFSPQAKWITNMHSQNATNTWIVYRKVVEINEIPAETITKIAVDSKYWLWINGKQVVFEGGLKRGPNPLDTYYDELNIAPYLKKGKNTIAVLVWYFGKDGFSHKSSGKAGLLFHTKVGDVEIASNKTWKSTVLKAYKTAGYPYSNFRLPESSLFYDAREDIGSWQNENYDDSRMTASMEMGNAGDYPWNNLIKRPIPLWKDYGLKKYTNTLSFPFISTGDTIVCTLPYNAQITPYFKIEANGTEKIQICTDNYLFYDGGDTGIRTEYIAKKGLQEYESLGWINGHKVYYFIPKGVKVLDLQFRETGYNTEFAGTFHSSDIFLNKLWDKARRSVYVNMRDTYMDCPERERAQWSGDQVHEAGQAFYMFDDKAHSLAKKYLYETTGRQKNNGSLFGPVPAGNWDKELPEHILSSIGYYGVWNYYLHTGDAETLKDTYSGIKKYLELWEQDGQGTMKLRRGDWTWGDWGKEKDMLLIYNLWYYLAVKSLHHTAELIGEKQDAKRFYTFLNTFEAAFNKQFWTMNGYRSKAYQGRTDDRVQALAVVSGIASADKYPVIVEILKKEQHCSPFMEKFVLEAMFKMEHGDDGLTRFKQRFDYMINHPYFTTLFEGWGIGTEGFGGGSVNHGWGGAGTIVLIEYLLGIKPIEPQFKIFQILPSLGQISNVAAKIPSLSGTIAAEINQNRETFSMQLIMPNETKAIVGIPNNGYKKIFLNNKLIWKEGQIVNNNTVVKNLDEKAVNHIKFQIIKGGTFKFRATR